MHKGNVVTHTKLIIWLTSNRGANLWDEAKGEKLLRDFNGKKLITFFLLIILNLKEQRLLTWFHPTYRSFSQHRTIIGLELHKIRLSILSFILDLQVKRWSILVYYVNDLGMPYLLYNITKIILQQIKQHLLELDITRYKR